MTTKAQALDHLTDALAGEDVAGEPTVAGAIDKLATMIEDGDITIGGGGGGGAVFIDNSAEGKALVLNASFNQIKDYILNEKLPITNIIASDNSATLVTCDGYGVDTDAGDVITAYQVYFGEYTFSASTPTEQLES